MALNSFTVATIARQLKGISDAVINDCELTKYLKDKGLISFNNGGDGFDLRLRSSRSAIGGATEDFGSNTAATVSPFVKVSGVYKKYRWDLFESLLQEERNKNAPSEAKMFDMIMEDLNEVKQAAADRLATHLYGDGATQSTGDVSATAPMLGLEAIIDDDNTYLGVARSSNTYIQAQIKTSTGSTFDQDTDNNGVAQGIQDMDELFVSCSKGAASDGGSIRPDLNTTKDSPDYFIGSSTNWRRYCRCLQAQRMYTDAKQDSEQTITYQSRPFKWDTYCTADRIYFLNSKHLNLDIIPSQLLVSLPPILTQNPLGRIHVIYTQGAFYSRNPRYLGAIRTS